MTDVKVTIEGDQKELIILTGDAPEQRQKNGFTATTTISGVIDFYHKRKELISPLHSHLAIDLDKSTVALVVNDTLTAESIRINGLLKENDDYRSLGINTEKLYLHSDLERALRMKPHLFPSVDAYDKTMQALRNFKVEVTNAFGKEDDRVGKSAIGKSTNIVHEMEKSIQIKLAPFTDAPASTFDVLILVKEDAGQAKFYLECIQILLEMDRIKKEILDKLMIELADLPILCQ